jgi:CrcB protein
VRPLLLVASGGVLGAEARYAVTSVGHPLWAVLAVNVVGGLLIGLLTGAGPSPGARLFLGVGVLGGFTTFSTYAVQGRDLLAAGDWGRAAAYLVGTPVLVLAATVPGVLLGERYLSPRPSSLDAPAAETGDPRRSRPAP